MGNTSTQEQNSSGTGGEPVYSTIHKSSSASSLSSLRRLSFRRRSSKTKITETAETEKPRRHSDASSLAFLRSARAKREGGGASASGGAATEIEAAERSGADSRSQFISQPIDRSMLAKLEVYDVAGPSNERRVEVERRGTRALLVESGDSLIGPPIRLRSALQSVERLIPLPSNGLNVNGSEANKGNSNNEVTLVRNLVLEKLMTNKWISGLAVTKKNEYVLVDLKEAHIIDDEGTLKRTVGIKGPNRLQEPIAVGVMPNGNLVFSDHAAQDVKIFAAKGQHLATIRDKTPSNIAGIATNDRREIFIACPDRRQVSVHNESDELLYTIPASRESKSLFDHPYSIAYNHMTGDVIVGDDYRRLITAVSTPEGRVRWRYCPTGNYYRHFFPSSICVDGEGNIFVADLYNEKVYMLDSAGKFLKVLLSRSNGLKGGPAAIATDGLGRIVVCDEEKTLKIFRYCDVTTRPQQPLLSSAAQQGVAVSSTSKQPTTVTSSCSQTSSAVSPSCPVSEAIVSSGSPSLPAIAQASNQSQTAPKPHINDDDVGPMSKFL